MGTFDYPSPSNNVNFISVVPDQPRATIFQVSFFKMSYFHNSWTLPSPSVSMEGIGNLGMPMPLFATEVSCNIVQQTSANLDLAPSQELDPVLEPIWAQYSLVAQYPLDLVLASDEVILEAMTGPDRTWDDLHHRSYFLPELRRVEAGEFVLTMNGDSPCPINPMDTHEIYTEGNMASIATMIPIDISKNPAIMENVFIGVDCSPEEIQNYTELVKEICDVFSWSYEDMPGINPQIVGKKNHSLS
jgi:hypothetical protein